MCFILYYIYSVFPKKCMVRTAVLCFIAFLFMAAPFAYADVPRLISVQGRLTDNFNTLITAPTDFTFKIYDAETLGNLLWTEPWTGASAITPDSSGVFSVLLGSSNPLNIGFDEPYWLEVQIEGEALTPRQQMGSSGYAINIADNSVTSAKIVDGAVTGTDIQDNSVTLSDVNFVGAIAANKWCVANVAGNALDCTADSPGGSDADWTISGTDMYSSVSGNVGIGETSPQRALHISAAQDANIRLQDTAGVDPAAYIEFYNATNRYGWVGLPGAEYLQIATDFGKNIIIDPSGYVGVGLVNPAYMLDVFGDVRWSGTLQGGSVPWARISGFSGDTTPDTIADDGVISSAEVNFNYAGSASKGGAATTAVALAADGSNCPAGQYPLGVDSSGNVQGCTVDQTGTGADADWTISGINMYSAVSGNVGIGLTNPTSKLDVAGSIKIADGTQGAGKVLTSDASGLASWQDSSSGTSPHIQYPPKALHTTGTYSPTYDYITLSSFEQIRAVFYPYTSMALYFVAKPSVDGTYTINFRTKNIGGIWWSCGYNKALTAGNVYVIEDTSALCGAWSLQSRFVQIDFSGPGSLETYIVGMK